MGDRYGNNFIAFVLGFFIYGGTYVFMSWIMPKISKRYVAMEVTVQADFVSRFHSSLNGAAFPGLCVHKT